MRGLLLATRVDRNAESAREEKAAVFLVDCRSCGKPRLVGPQRIRSMRTIASGVIAVELTCYCGQPALVITGKAIQPPGSARPPGPAAPVAVTPTPLAAAPAGRA